MTTLHRISIYVLSVSLFFSVAFIGSLYGAGTASAKSLIPEGLTIEDVYKPGFGKAVGKTILVQGKVVIMHADKLRGYWAKKDLPLYKGDTLITEDRGRIRFGLIDESILTLGSRTKLVINRSVYDPDKKSRSSFLGMDLGKARFLVTKFIGFKRSEFKVKTKTAVAGVRGSDFIIEIDEETDATTVTTLEDTTVEVQPTADLEAPPTILEALERTEIEEGEMPTDPVEVSAFLLEQITQDFMVTEDTGEPTAEEVVEEKELEEDEEEEEEEDKAEEEEAEEEEEDADEEEKAEEEEQAEEEAEEEETAEEEQAEEEEKADEGAEAGEGEEQADEGEVAPATDGEEGVEADDEAADDAAGGEGTEGIEPTESPVGPVDTPAEPIAPPEAVIEEETIFVSVDEIDEPSIEDTPFEEVIDTDIGAVTEETEQAEVATETSEQISEEIVEDAIEELQKLPDFPGTPR